MDDIDRQIERDSFFLEKSIAVRMPVPLPTGRCLNCDEPVRSPSFYCDSDCRDDHEKEVRLRAANPKR